MIYIITTIYIVRMDISDIIVIKVENETKIDIQYVIVLNFKDIYNISMFHQKLF